MYSQGVFTIHEVELKITIFTLFLCNILFAQVTLLYFNDAHEIAPVIDSQGNRGGIARVKMVVEKIRSENSNVLVLFGGDCAGGTLFGAVYKGLPMIHAFNQLPVDIASFGQHDFDFTSEHTRILVDSSDFEWVTTNLVESSGVPFHRLPRYIVKNVDGLRIAFLGLTDAMQTTVQDGSILQHDLIESAKSTLLHIDRQADVVIALTQTNPEINEKLLLACPDIDAIFSEERAENRSHVFYVGSRPVISPCGNMGSVARLDVAQSKDGIQTSLHILPVDSTVIPNPELLQLEEFYMQKLETDLSQQIALSETILDAGINSHFKCRWAETTIGNLITDAFRDYHHADIAVINGGGIRANIPAGVITRKNILAALPFHNHVSCITIRGSELLIMLEHGVAQVENKGGAFLQISGASYVYNPKSEPGKRIVFVLVNKQPLQPEKLYTLALPDYILNHGNEFQIKPEKVLVQPGPQDSQVVIAYLQKQQHIRAEIKGRIKIKGNE